MRTALGLFSSNPHRRQRRRRRRQTYGVSEPGAYSSTPAWWSREHWRSELWTDLASDEVTSLRSGVGTRGPVSVKAVFAVAVAISTAADGATGRNALPGNAALTARAKELDPDAADYWIRVASTSGYGLTTTQKAVQVLTKRGWLVLVRVGKNYLSREERTEMWRAGSPARQRRNVWACTLPAHVRPPIVSVDTNIRSVASSRGEVVDNSTVDMPIDQSSCDLPTTRRVEWATSVPRNKYFKPDQASRNGAPRRTPRKAAAGKRTYRADYRVLRLAKDLRACVPWLRPVSHQRIMPSLHRFAINGWSAAQLQSHLDRLLQLHGWTVPGSPAESVEDPRPGRTSSPPTTMRSAWGYLAFLLRQIEPSDLAAEHEYEAQLKVQDEYQRALIYGVPCSHGQPAGNQPSPNRGVLACPLCRRTGAEHSPIER